MSKAILIASSPVAADEVRRLAEDWFGDMLKFVVDVSRRRIALGGELHADAEAKLLDEGARQEDLWGGNYHPDRPAGERVELTALINIRPSQGNRSMELQDPALRSQVGAIALELIEGGP